VANAAGYVVYLRASRSLPDQILVLPAETRFTSGLLHSYGTAAVCAFDAQGLIGQAAPEVTLR